MDRKANAAFYGNPAITPEMIFEGSGNAAPQAADNFVQVLAAHTNQLPIRPGAAAVNAAAPSQAQPQDQADSEVKTYGMNMDPDEDLRD
jgi:hypothetical protein